MSYTDTGDFVVNGKWTFEIGGKNKTLKQVKEIEKAYRVIDDGAFTVNDA